MCISSCAGGSLCFFACIFLYPLYCGTYSPGTGWGHGGRLEYSTEQTSINNQGSFNQHRTCSAASQLGVVLAHLSMPCPCPGVQLLMAMPCIHQDLQWTQNLWHRTWKSRHRTYGKNTYYEAVGVQYSFTDSLPHNSAKMHQVCTLMISGTCWLGVPLQFCTLSKPRRCSPGHCAQWPDHWWFLHGGHRWCPWLWAMVCYPTSEPNKAEEFSLAYGQTKLFKHL